MDYYTYQSAYEARGIDYDLLACLQYNPQPFAPIDIARVLAVWEGERDGDDWRWVLLLTDGRVAYLKGWCDYTGWDCQSAAGSAFFDDAATAVRLGVPDDADADEIKDALSAQLAAGKAKTQHEQVGEAMRGDAEPA